MTTCRRDVLRRSVAGFGGDKGTMPAVLPYPLCLLQSLHVAGRDQRTAATAPSKSRSENTFPSNTVF